MKKLLLIIVLLFSLSLPTLAQDAGDNTVNIATIGNWGLLNTCPTFDCAYVAIGWNPANLRINNVIVDNRFLDLDIAVQITFVSDDIVTFIYPTGLWSQNVPGNAGRYVEITEYGPNDYEIDFVGIQSVSVFTCSCDGLDPANVFRLPPGQR